MKFSIKDFFSKCDQIRSFLDLVTVTKEILNAKLQFLCDAIWYKSSKSDTTIIQLRQSVKVKI